MVLLIHSRLSGRVFFSLPINKNSRLAFYELSICKVLYICCISRLSYVSVSVYSVACSRLSVSEDDRKSERATSGISCERDPGVPDPARRPPLFPRWQRAWNRLYIPFPTSTSFNFFPLFMLPKEENHIPKSVLKEIQKERVENVMKGGGQRVAIDFTVSDDMRNKVSTTVNHQSRWPTDWRRTDTCKGRTD